MLKTLCLNKCSIKCLFTILVYLSNTIFIVENWKIRPSLHLKCVKCYHDDVILTSGSRLDIHLYMPWWTCLAFPMHATVSNGHFLRSSIFLDNLQLFIDFFSQLVDLLFLCDVTDTISRKY